jgi:hypothetical protein
LAVSNWPSDWVDCPGLRRSGIKYWNNCWAGVLNGVPVWLEAGSMGKMCDKEGCADWGFFGIEVYDIRNSAKRAYDRYPMGRGPLRIVSVRNSEVTLARDDGSTIMMEIAYLLQTSTPTVVRSTFPPGK